MIPLLCEEAPAFLRSGLPAAIFVIRARPRSFVLTRPTVETLFKKMYSCCDAHPFYSLRFPSAVESPDEERH